MSFCGTIIREVTWLERQAQILTTKICTVEAVEKCADWQDQGYNKCTETRDEGYNSCTQSRDEGYNACCDWAPCSWFCDAFVWISNIVCIVWTWVSSIVCVVWNWISKWVCRLFHWIWTTICKLVVSIIFWFIRRVLLFIIFLPCGFGSPDLDPRIKHIFVLVLENRSFDHMFGATAIRGSDAETGRPTEIVRRPDDAFNEVHDSNGQVTHTCQVGTGQHRSVAVDPGHEFADTLLALCGSGRNGLYPPYPTIDNSGFAQAFSVKSPDDPCTIMLSYRGAGDGEHDADVPVITALAKEFVVCDHWFSSVPGPTWPNRLFFHAASSAGLDDSPSGFDSGVDALLSGILFDNGTVFDLLDSENVDWAVYHGDSFPQALALSGMDLGTTTTHFHDMDDFEEDLADGSIANYVFIEPDYGDDVTGNTYKCGNSQHPLDDVTHGERLIKRVYEAIRNSPAWGQSILIVTYDEGGGFYDHVGPGPAVPPGDSVTDPTNNHNNFDFSQLGVRVPAVVCSPWIPKNLIDHRVYDHATVPATVERLWGLPSMTDRDAQVNDLKSLLTLATPRTDAPTTLPDAAAPEVHCDGDPKQLSTGQSASALTTKETQPTLVHPLVLAAARQRNQTAITSSVAGFLRVVLRRDLMLAKPTERLAIYEQARRFVTVGEVGVYSQKVMGRIASAERATPRTPRTPRTPAAARPVRRRRGQYRPPPSRGAQRGAD